MKLISLGNINKKFFRLAYFYLAVILFLNITSYILNYMEASIDNMPLLLIICHCPLLLCIFEEDYFKKKSTDKKRESVSIINNKINYLSDNYTPYNKKKLIILILMIILDYIYDAGLIYFQKIKAKESELVFSEIFKFMDTLFLFIFFRVFHKIIFYRHQYISLFIIILMGLIKFSYKIIFYKNPDFYLIGFIILFPLIDSVNNYFFQKYMFYEYYSPNIILFSIGIIYLFISAPIFIIFHYVDCGDSQLCELLSSRQKFPDITRFIISLIIFILYSIFYSGQHFMRFLIIEKFSVFHLVLIVTLGELINTIFDQFSNFNATNLTITLITYCFEILGVLVFIEIIELNFCSLNVNLKKNIIFRAGNEIDEIYQIKKEDENELIDSIILEETYLDESSTVY